jgi:H+/Cl- antiporter ClcA
MNQESIQPSGKRNASATILYLCKWAVLCACIGTVAGMAAAIFLASLDWVTNYREAHLFIIAFLPLAGLLIGTIYHYKGNSIVKGNHLLLEEIHTPQKTLPFIMAPLIYISTVITHLFGGSAGREGTAIQMGGSIADQFAKRFKFDAADRKLILIAGIAAGFSAVFGTPVAGIVFGLEVANIGKAKFKAFIPCIFTAIIADVVCRQCGILHTHYSISFVPQFTVSGILFSILAGICFGCVARFFSFLSHRTTTLFAQTISYPPLRPFIGGICMVVLIWSMGTTKYIGLGIPTIVGSFYYQLPAYDFAIKLLLTVFTLSAGFKGGEVTPLFFIGATLGNALSLFIPLPMGLLAGMGFVAVFAGAANTPIACIVMSVELFGIAPGGYIAVACVFASFVSGKGIYDLHPTSGKDF